MTTQLIGISGKINSGKDFVGELIMEMTPEINWEEKKFADKLKDTVCLLLGCTREKLENREYKEGILGEEWWYFKEPDSTRQTGFKMIPYIGNEDIVHLPLIKLTPRKILQLLGTEAGRDIIHINIWTNATFAEYKPILDMSENPARTAGINVREFYPSWLLTDTRFPNEGEAIQRRNGIILRVERPFGLRFPDLTEFEDPENPYKFTPELKDNVSEEFYDMITHPSEISMDDFDVSWIIYNDSDVDYLKRQLDVFLNAWLDGYVI